jgi:hypothetical protein
LIVLKFSKIKARKTRGSLEKTASGPAVDIYSKIQSADRPVWRSRSVCARAKIVHASKRPNLIKSSFEREKPNQSLEKILIRPPGVLFAFADAKGRNGEG